MIVDVKKVEEIIRHVAATEIMPRFRNLQSGDIREKKPGDFVTVADEAAEKVLTKMLQGLLPGALVVGEEAVAKDPIILERLKDSKPVWIIDPIDGTRFFANDAGGFGVLVALAQNGVTEYGWVFDVCGNRMLFAKRGDGAYLDGKSIEINDVTEMAKLTGRVDLTVDQHKHFRNTVKDIAAVQCSVSDYIDLVIGKIDFVIYSAFVSPWDHAAVCLITQEAGGYVAMGDGNFYNPTLYQRPAYLMAAPNKDLWEKLHTVFYPVLKKESSACSLPKKWKRLSGMWRQRRLCRGLEIFKAAIFVQKETRKTL